MSRWADFNGPPPGADALLRAGFSGVIRYIGLGSHGKRIHANEYQDYTSRGMGVLLVAELGTGDAWAALDDYSTGRVRARAAVADARAEGIPDHVGIACAADAHAASREQICDAVQYARGFADEAGKARTGFYGFQETSRAVHDAGVVGWHWRCGSRPSTEDMAWVNFWQRNDGSVMVGGTDCDINETMAPLEENTVDWNDPSGVKDPQGNPYSYGVLINYTNTYANLLPGINAKLDALTNTLSDDEAAVISAVRAQATGQVDIHALAAALAPLLPPESTPDEIGTAVRTAFADHLGGS